MKKKKWYHTADNTILDFANVDYKYNWDTYNQLKKVFWLIAPLGLVISLLIVVLSQSGVIQTIAGAFMGGILSLIVWLFTISHQDKTNYELAFVDLHIMKIDELLELQHSKTQFINPEEEELVDYDNQDVGLRFLLLLQLISFLSSEEGMDTSRLMLKFLNGEELSVNDFKQKSEEILNSHRFRTIASDEEWDKIVAWNNWYLDWQLNELKKKLQRYKTYILCGNAPIQYK